MKKILRIIALVAIIGLLLTPIIAYASDVTGARYEGTVRITNAGASAATSVSTNMTLAVSTLVSNGFADDEEDFAIRIASTDTAFMPGYSTNPWAIFVPLVGASGNVDYKFYSGNVTGGKIRYFPAATGATTNDSATFEPGSNFQIEQSGYFDTTAGYGKYALKKADAIQIRNDTATSGTIKAEIMGATSWTGAVSGAITTGAWKEETFTEQFVNNIEIREWDSDAGSETVYLNELQVWDLATSAWVLPTSAAGAWVTMANAYDNNTATAATIASGGAGVWTSFITLSLAESVRSTKVRYYCQAEPTITQIDIDVNNSVAASVSATSISSGERDVTLRGVLNSPQWATGNVLHFDGTATGYVSLGAIYNSQATWAASLWFKPDANFSAGSPSNLYILDKEDADEWLSIFLSVADGKLHFYHAKVGGGAFVVNLTSTQTSWTANTWYHVIVSSSAAAGHRLIVNGGAAVTSATTGTLPNSTDMKIGNYTPPAAEGFVGQIQNVVMFTDDLTPAEEAALYTGTAPGDETDYWYIDGGSGTAITSYGSAANAGTAAAGCAWQTATYTSGSTGRLCDLTLQVDSSRWGKNMESSGVSAGVPDNANNWYSCLGGAMPYLEYQEITISGVQQQYVDWEYSTIFEDSSAGNHDMTPTFPSDSSDSNVTAAMIDLTPVTEAQADTFTLADLADILTAAPSAIPQLYTELDFTHVPGGSAINEILGTGGVPQAVWWFPFIFLGIGIIGLIVYGATAARLVGTQITQGAGQGSLVAMVVVCEGLLVVAGIMNPIPLWPAILFVIPAWAIISSTKHTSLG